MVRMGVLLAANPVPAILSGLVNGNKQVGVSGLI
jgi:hypothetical protein